MHHGSSSVLDGRHRNGARNRYPFVAGSSIRRSRDHVFQTAWLVWGSGTGYGVRQSLEVFSHGSHHGRSQPEPMRLTYGHNVRIVLAAARVVGTHANCRSHLATV